MNAYTLVHIVQGGMSLRDSNITKIFFAWQLGQLALDIKIFMHQLRIEQGNSIPHTLRKVAEFAIGRILF